MTVSAPRTDICTPWATPDDITVINAGTRTAMAANPAALLDALMAASNILFRLSGSRWAGLCTETVRPNAQFIDRDHGRPITASAGWLWFGSSAGYFGGSMWAGQYSRWGWMTCNQDEDPGGYLIPAVTLGGYPVVEVTEVLVDGVVVDPSTYRVDDYRKLVRVINPALTPGDTDNPGWPCSQRMDLPPTEIGTWQVTYQYGTAPPTDGRLAAAELGYQLYLATTPGLSGKANLPQRVTSISRQGLEAVVLDPLAFLDKGRTGLVLCDYFLASSNPGGLRRRATVSSPDIKRPVRRTGPTG